MKKQKIRIILRSNDHQQLDKAVREIVRAVKKAGSKVLGPIPMPNKVKYFTVLRSPNNDKKSREQFEIITYKRLLDVEILMQQSNKGIEETMDALMKLHISPSVDVEIK
jgi:small subunit ribosomal protein S10